MEVTVHIDELVVAGGGPVSPAAVAASMGRELSGVLDPQAEAAVERAVSSALAAEPTHDR